MTTLGKFRHLSRCSTHEGHFVVLAIDHRTNLLAQLNRYASEPLTDSAFMAFKQSLIRSLAPEASAVLTDPAYGIGAGISAGIIGGHIGLLAPIEVTNYDLHPSQRDVEFIPGWSVSKIKRVGGDGVKLLLPYHPGEASAEQKRAIVRQIVDKCGRYDIPFFLEPIPYPLDADGRLENAELRQVSTEMAQSFSAMGVDVLKMSFPLDPAQEPDEEVWLSACRELNAACSVPWALLSGGVDYEIFAKQVRTACMAGASGVIVGRAVWNEAVFLQGAERAAFFRATAAERMRALAAICHTQATPWYTRVEVPNAPLNWYETYQYSDPG